MECARSAARREQESHRLVADRAVSDCTLSHAMRMFLWNPRVHYLSVKIRRTAGKTMRRRCNSGINVLGGGTSSDYRNPDTPRFYCDDRSCCAACGERLRLHAGRASSQGFFTRLLTRGPQTTAARHMPPAGGVPSLARSPRWSMSRPARIDHGDNVVESL